MAQVEIHIYYKGMAYPMPWLDEFIPERVKEVEKSLSKMRDFFAKEVTEPGHIFINWFDDKIGNEFQLVSPDLQVAELTAMWRNHMNQAE